MDLILLRRHYEGITKEPNPGLALFGRWRVGGRATPLNTHKLKMLDSEIIWGARNTSIPPLFVGKRSKRSRAMKGKGMPSWALPWVFLAVGRGGLMFKHD